jgi:hypothetical protein
MEPRAVRFFIVLFPLFNGPVRPDIPGE